MFLLFFKIHKLAGDARTSPQRGRRTTGGYELGYPEDPRPTVLNTIWNQTIVDVYTIYITTSHEAIFLPLGKSLECTVRYFL